jgi:hypothetical protein
MRGKHQIEFAFKHGHKPGKRSLSIQNAFTIGFDGTPHWATKVLLFMNS